MSSVNPASPAPASATPSTTPSDRVLRAITTDGAFRVLAARTTDLVRASLKLQSPRSADRKALAELLTGAVLIRETMSPVHRVQVILSRDGAGAIVADSHPLGVNDAGALIPALTRGLITRQDQDTASALLTEGALLKVIRSLPRGRLHQSVVEAKPGGVSEALMSYLHDSEQVVATLATTAVFDADGTLVAAGGFVVQLLPECTEAPLAVMTERLAHDFASLDARLVATNADARALSDELLYGFPHEVLADSPLRFGCDCSEARVLAAISTLGAEELTSIVNKGEVLTMTCEYCGHVYNLAPERLRSLLTRN